MRAKIHLVHSVDGKKEVEGLVISASSYTLNVKVEGKRWILPWHNILSVVET
jgi:hypothetical protein